MTVLIMVAQHFGSQQNGDAARKAKETERYERERERRKTIHDSGHGVYKGTKPFVCSNK